MYEYITILLLLWVAFNYEWFQPAVTVVCRALREDFHRDPLGVVFASVMMLVTLSVTGAFLVYGFWIISRAT